MKGWTGRDPARIFSLLLPSPSFTRFMRPTLPPASGDRPRQIVPTFDFVVSPSSLVSPNRRQLTGVYELSPISSPLPTSPFTVGGEVRRVHCRMLTGPGFYHWLPPGGTRRHPWKSRFAIFPHVWRVPEGTSVTWRPIHPGFSTFFACRQRSYTWTTLSFSFSSSSSSSSSIPFSSGIF